MHNVPHQLAPAMLALSLEDQPVAFWRIATQLLSEPFPHRIAVVWSNGLTMLFVRNEHGDVDYCNVDSAIAEPLRAGSLYSSGCALQGFRDPVTALPPAVFASLPQSRSALVQERACDRVVTLAFMSEVAPGWIQVSIALYAGKGVAFREKPLQQLHRWLQPLVSRHMQKLQEQSFQQGVMDLLRNIPVGLVFVSWQETYTFVNDEGYRQAHAWAWAPDARPGKALRSQFVIADEIRAALSDLRQGWVDGLSRLEPPKQTHITVTHPKAPKLKASVSLAFDPGQPLTTPSFVIRFLGVGAQASNALFEPNDAQLSALGSLSPAEREVAMLVMQGLDNRAIADRLHREVSTVKAHLTSVYAKLGLSSRTQLASLQMAR